MRKTKPTARVATAKTVISATERAKVRGTPRRLWELLGGDVFEIAFISINMIVKIKYEGSIIEIAHFCGAAVCQILALNNFRSERELVVGQEILVPVMLARLIKA